MDASVFTGGTVADLGVMESMTGVLIAVFKFRIGSPSEFILRML